MIKKPITLLVTIAIVACFVAVAYAAVAAMSVQVKKGRVLAKPSCFGKLVKTLPYGARIKTTSQKGEWYKVAKPKGWIHSSALTEKKIVFQKGKKTKVGADSQEMALAGKGFNKEVEARFQASGRGNYKAVDQMERSYNYSGKQLRKFAAKGGLNTEAR